MSNALRRHPSSSRPTPRSALLAALLCFGATGCTAGGVTYNGNSIHAHANLEYLVEFYPTNTNGIYATEVTWNEPHYAGLATFSFDPDGPSSTVTGNYVPYNTKQSIPEGEYRVQVVVYTTPSTGVTFTSQPFQHTYPSTFDLDDYTGAKIQAQIYDFAIYPYMATCPSPYSNGNYTTVPLCATAPGGLPLSNYF